MYNIKAKFMYRNDQSGNRNRISRCFLKQKRQP